MLGDSQSRPGRRSREEVTGSLNWGSSHWDGGGEALRGAGEVGANRFSKKQTETD